MTAIPSGPRRSSVAVRPPQPRLPHPSWPARARCRLKCSRSFAARAAPGHMLSTSRPRWSSASVVLSVWWGRPVCRCSLMRWHTQWGRRERPRSRHLGLQKLGAHCAPEARGFQDLQHTRLGQPVGANWQGLQGAAGPPPALSLCWTPACAGGQTGPAHLLRSGPSAPARPARPGPAISQLRVSTLALLPGLPVARPRIPVPPLQTRCA